MDVKLILTSDGSHSLFNTALDETYHSKHGAIQESMHVFIKNGLEFFVTRNPGKPIHVFEAGFGTGLNALLTIIEADQRDINVSYSSIEAFPIAGELLAALNYPQLMFNTDARPFFDKIHGNAWDEWTEISKGFRLKKIRAKLEEVSLGDEGYDLIYFDAFAPSKQPSMWELSVLEKVCSRLSQGGVFVTYCAKGQLKRDLKSFGMEVESLEGPPGKKEMVRAIKL